ncbi:gfo/Idh/MocA family oxidoreductase [bacterium]|nr:gfo/Idh/MocA family oxidoreductase [bacterium]
MMKIAVIGYGSIGQRHTQVLESLFPNAEITIVTRQRLDRPHVNHLSALDLSSLHYAVIAVPTADHFNVLTQIRTASTAPILVEKPLFSQSIPTAFNRSGIFVGYNLRFHPVLQKVREWVRGQAIFSVRCNAGQYLPTWRPGRPYRDSYSAKRSEGGGVLLDLSHEIDYLRWILGPLTPTSSLIGHLSELEIDSDDVAMIQGKLTNGGTFQLSLDYLSTLSNRDLVIHGQRGTCKANLVSGEITIANHGQPIQRDTLTVERNHTYEAMHKALFESDPDLCSFENGLEVLEIIKKAWEVNSL